MIPRDARPLTEGEWAALTPDLVAALKAAGVDPRIVPHAHPGARIAQAWRGHLAVLTQGDSIWWPNAPADFSTPYWAEGLAVLQHELHHAWEFATGRLTLGGYLINPGNWTYDFDIGRDQPWGRLGAEQRAVAAEHLWMAEHGMRLASEVAALRGLLPWARSAGKEAV